MAKAIKCDRCGTYIDYDEENKKPSREVFQIEPGIRPCMESRRYDICGECNKAFHEWGIQPREDRLRNVMVKRGE